MKAIGAIQRKLRVSRPCRTPGVPGRQEDAVHVGCGQRIRFAHAWEVCLALQRRPHHIERWARAGFPDQWREFPHERSQNDPRFGQRRGALLKDDEVPSLFADLADRASVLPVLREAEIVEGDRARRDLSAVGGSDLADERRKVVDRGQTVADEQHADFRRRRLLAHRREQDDRECAGKDRHRTGRPQRDDSLSVRLFFSTSSSRTVVAPCFNRSRNSGSVSSPGSE